MMLKEKKIFFQKILDKNTLKFDNIPFPVYTVMHIDYSFMFWSCTRFISDTVQYLHLIDLSWVQFSSADFMIWNKRHGVYNWQQGATSGLYRLYQSSATHLYTVLIFSTPTTKEDKRKVRDWTKTEMNVYVCSFQLNES